MKNLNIIFRNEHFIVVYKPSLYLSVPSRLGKSDERPCLGLILEEEVNQPVFPVHRLDFEVDGLVLFALNSNAHREANRWFEHKIIKKYYRAITINSGQSYKPGDEFEWKYKLAQGKKRSFIAEHGDATLTKGKVLEVTQDRIIWELSPITGKRHQLRVVMYLQGHPIIGDKLYNSDQTHSKEGIALTAVELDLSDIPVQKRLGLPENIKI